MDGIQADYADFSFANLPYSWLRRASLKNAIFHGANLYSAHLERSDLTEADLRSSKLGHSNLNLSLIHISSTGAHLKLQHFGLDQYFNNEHSVFGEISENREMLAKVAFHRLYMQNEQAKPNELIFIGDTPNDVRCANAIGADVYKRQLIIHGKAFSHILFENIGCPNSKLCATFRFYTIADRNDHIKIIVIHLIYFSVSGSVGKFCPH